MNITNLQEAIAGWVHGQPMASANSTIENLRYNTVPLVDKIFTYVLGNSPVLLFIDSAERCWFFTDELAIGARIMNNGEPLAATCYRPARDFELVSVDAPNDYGNQVTVTLLHGSEQIKMEGLGNNGEVLKSVLPLLLGRKPAVRETK